jgi:uncharacterized protein (TIGR02996 family)
MSDETAFLRAIQANPTDATAKLVYADWLDERGEHEKAEYLRLATTFSPLKKATDAQIRRFADLEYRHRVWVELLREGPPVWDEVTTFALGRLRGLLDCYALLNGHESDIGYDFDAHLRTRTGSVAEMAPVHFGPEYAPVGVAPLEDWEAALRAVLNEWLFMELGQLSNGRHTRLGFLTARGRDGLVGDGVGHIRGVINPTAGWRLQITENRFYAINWADIALESADRVLFLHFSFSD